MLLDLNMPFKKIDRQDAQGESMAKTLAIFMDIVANPIPLRKANIWANELYENGQLEVDSADLELLKSYIEQVRHPNPHVIFADGFKAQILNKIFDLLAKNK